MRRTSGQSETSNVIRISFNSDEARLSPEDYQNHLGALVDTGSDPVADLLNEFEDICENDGEKESFDIYRLGYKEDLLTMGDALMDQIKCINDMTKKMDYYLSEMNFDNE